MITNQKENIIQKRLDAKKINHGFESGGFLPTKCCLRDISRITLHSFVEDRGFEFLEYHLILAFPCERND